MNVKTFRADLIKKSSLEKKQASERFFKTGKGQYGDGDVFIGAVVPDIRLVAKKHASLRLEEVSELLKSPIHEERLGALFVLVHQFATSDFEKKKRIYNFYIKHKKQVNNWDLVDLSAPKIVGAYLFEGSHPKAIAQMKVWAGSRDLWTRRIGILSTFYFTKQKVLKPCFSVSNILLNDSHDLIHKAVGWMLREAGKVDQKALEKYLKPRYQKMPRTMLRYCIEKFPENKRQKYLKGKI